MTALTQGGNTAVTGATISVTLKWPTAKGTLDASAYLLTASGRVRGDGDMVFFNQPEAEGGAVRVASRDKDSIAFEVVPAKLPSAIERIVFCLTVDGTGTMAGFHGASMAVTGDAASLATFDPDLSGATEAAMIFAELYARDSAWKVRAVAQGFNGGLGPLAMSFGIDVGDAAPAAAPPPPVAAPASAATPKPVSLSKITLDKAKPTVSLEKRGTSFGEITINLNWTSGKGGLFGASKKIDLDLGCLYELTDGRKGIVQALGNTFGDYRSEPYIELSGDDRTGAVAAGETLRINGGQWPAIKRVALFAYIYEGAPNWQATDGVVTITMPDQPPIEVRLSDGQNNRGFCGIATIENASGGIRFTRLVEYFVGHKDFDGRVGWGMSWQAGSK